MKKHIFSNIAFVCLLAATVSLNSGCDDKLNALPGEKKVYGDIIIDQPTAQIALNGVYYRFANSGSSADEDETTLWGTFEQIPASAAGLGTYPYGNALLEDNSRVRSGSSIVSSFWTYSYQLANAANGVMEQLEEIDDSKFIANRKAEIMAEARWLRAYAHVKLMGWYGQFWDMESDKGVMLRDRFVTVNNLNITRSSVADSYKFILDDIEYAIQNAPDENPNHYVNKWVAKALKARLLMMRGNGSDYVDVVGITEDIINNGPYELEKNLKDIFFTAGFNSKEVMLCIYPYPNQSGHSKEYLDTYERAGVVTTLAMETLYADDPRREWMIGKTEFETENYILQPDGSYEEVEGIAYNIGKYTGSAGEVAYCLRLTEMYLLNAEALLRSGGSVDQARNRIKEVKAKAGITDFAALDAITDREQMLRALWNEWAMNMCYEDGQEWFALLRLPFATIQQIKPQITSEDYRILPIPSVEFTKNPQLKGKQNPGYTE